ncbi:hypothetical protein KPL39_02205 [Clostridium gasigenes]|uniref:hypothetical protein n=1 Tax=Clostridium gasigenes TaxID=94869 RepID=UPI001C0D0D52|nr:hypothetical protein [Clostridium gasigenes]MBU3135074.1 hypothetical protein [Clostridium gasigenes]
MKELKRLINIKSIIALGLLIGFLYLTALNKIDAQVYISIFGLVIGAYFTKDIKEDKEEHKM